MAVLVFDVDVDMALEIGDGLLGRAADVDGAEDFAVGVVDYGEVGRGVGEDVEPVVVGSLR